MPIGLLRKTITCICTVVVCAAPAMAQAGGENYRYDGAPQAMTVRDAMVGTEGPCPGQGSCCEPNGTPGCDDADCCNIVCAFDSFCCSLGWDSICVGEAESMCGDLCGGPPPPKGCGNCNEPHGGTGCDNQECEDIVCNLDNFCCSISWDANCVAAADAFCDCGGGDPGLGCADGSDPLISQLPSQVNGLFSDVSCDICGGGAQSMADQIVAAGPATIEFIRIWGGYFPNNVETLADFRVIGHADAAGFPGAVFYDQTVTPSDAQTTGVVLFGVDEWQVELTLAVPLNLPAGTSFIEIFTDTGFGTDDWFWETGNLDPINGIFDSTFALEVPGQAWGFTGFDMSWQACGGGTPPCESDDDCDPGFQCVDGACVPIPPDPTGGCCQCDGETQFCTVETESDCADLGGAYLGDDAACETGGGGDTLIVSATIGTAIPDNSPAGLNVVIPQGESFTVLDLEVAVDITHTWIGDLCLTMSKDGGSTELLFSRMGADLGGNVCHDGSPFGCDSNDMDVTLDDDAGPSIEAQCGAGGGLLTGTFRPDPGSLAQFIGVDGAGSYSFNLSDRGGGDFGVWNSVTLIFSLEAGDPGPSPCEEVFPDQCAPPVAPQTLIIKQGACPAPINTNSHGVTLMVLAGAADFDVNDVDQSTLALSRCDGVGGSIGPADGPPGPPGVSINDLNHPNPDPATCATGGCTCNADQSSDGIDDLKLHFNTDEMSDVLELDGEAAGSQHTLVLTGALNNGDAFSAADCVLLVPPGSPPGILLVGSNVPGIWVDTKPLDYAWDMGGFASFNRAYQPNTNITVIGPLVPVDHSDWVLHRIWYDGVQYLPGDGTIEITVHGNSNSVVYQYRQAPSRSPDGRDLQSGGSPRQNTN